MKNPTLLMAVVALFGAAPLFAQTAAPATPPAPSTSAPARPPGMRASPHETISQTFDGRRDTRVMIVYGRPNVRRAGAGEARKIWGGLVPYGKVWRMGADEATLLLTQQPIDLGGTVLAAGGYTLDLQPEADGSAKLIVGKRLGQWGIPYEGSTEIARIALQKAEVEKPVEQFTIALQRNPAGGGVLKAAWENTEYSVPFTIKK